jgi:hypothetical protein
MCHVHNLEICPHYCTNKNILNTFWTLQFATTIADVNADILLKIFQDMKQK